MARPKDLNLEHAWRQRLRRSPPVACRSPRSARVRGSPLPRSTPGSDGSRLGRFPHVPSRPCSFRSTSIPLLTESTRCPALGVEIELPHQVRLRFDAPPEPEWLGRLVAALAGLPSQEATS